MRISKRLLRLLCAGAILLLSACTPTGQVTAALPTLLATPDRLANTAVATTVATATRTPGITPVLPKITPGIGTAPTATPTRRLATPIPPETVTMRTADGARLSGRYYRAPVADAPLVILVHQAGGTQQDWWKMGMVQYLRNQGEPYLAERFRALPEGVHFAVFTFDLRGHGLSSGGYDPNQATTFMNDMRTALEAARDLPGIDPDQIAAIGSSTGSAVLFRCQGICAGVMAISLYPTDAAQKTIEKLSAQGTVVFCVSEFACPESTAAHYYPVEYPKGGHGYELLTPTLVPSPASTLYNFLRLTFGFAT